jgi:hypothetical protein
LRFSFFFFATIAAISQPIRPDFSALPMPFCSARIAREEDEREAERLELEERRREEKRRKKAASNKFIDD